jgi:predicted alpha/beta superfamily hydrolase
MFLKLYKLILFFMQMKKAGILPLLFLCVTAWAQKERSLPKVVSGQLIRHDSFPSKYVTARNVDVWLPEGYSPQQKYPVLYMHDGQMLFDTATTWNKQAWDVDDVVTQLVKAGALRAVIVVGVWNGGLTRHSDYFPQKPFESLTAAERVMLDSATRTNGKSVFNDFKVHSDDYLKFLVEELKPFIDKNYATRSNRANTFIAGSSMGGLISMYAICEYPQVFGGAACLSTHWPGIFRMESNPVPAAFFRYLEKKLPAPRKHKIYFDYGDQTLDAMYPPLQKQADTIMMRKKFTHKNWLTKFFPGEDHSERAWSKRLASPLLFLLQR